MNTQIFIQTHIQGDWNVVTFSKSQTKRSNRTETVHREYFIPNLDADPNKIKTEIVRGNKFFNQKEGFLLGARYELMKMGRFEKKFVDC